MIILTTVFCFTADTQYYPPAEHQRLRAGPERHRRRRLQGRGAGAPSSTSSRNRIG